MTPLRQRMTEDMQARNPALNTQASYQVYLANERKLAPGPILIATAALRFLFKVSLQKDWTFDDVV